MLCREEGPGGFEVLAVSSLLLTHQRGVCFQVRWPCEACCDESCSQVHEISCFSLGLRKKSVTATEKHKVDVSQIFIG